MKLSSWLVVAGSLPLGAAVLAVACNAGPPGSLEVYACERTYSVCPNVAPVTSQDYADCARALDGPCGTTMRQYIQCITGKCDDAGAVDRGADQGRCSLVFNAYLSCAETAADIIADGGDAGRSREPVPVGPPTDGGGAGDAQ